MCTCMWYAHRLSSLLVQLSPDTTSALSPPMDLQASSSGSQDDGTAVTLSQPLCDVYDAKQ